MAQLKWDFINPVNYGTANQLYQHGNEQISKAIQGAGQAVTGYGEGIKKQQTDEILNALYQAQNPDQLSGAMANVNALQQQFGRGYDQAAVRKEVDARGQTLNQQALGQIQLTQAQNQQAAINPINQLNVQRLIASGMSPEQVAAYGNLKVDNSAQVTTAIGDSRDSRDHKYKVGRDLVADTNWNKDFVQRGDQFNKNYALAQNSDSRAAAASDVALATYISPNAGTTTIGYDSEGNAVTSQQPSRAEALAAANGISSSYLGNVTHNESNNNRYAKNPNSTATGTGQFIESTWIDVISRNRPDLVKGKSEPQILALRNDPKLSGEMTMALANENAAGLRKSNLPVNDGTVYLAHFAGLGGARSLLQANPNASAAAVLGPAVAKANGKVVQGKTVGEVINWAANQASRGGGGNTGGGGGSATPAAPKQALVPQANMAKVTGNYQTNVAKVTNDFNISEAKAKTKGSLASTGKNVDTWLASKKEFSLTGGGTNPIYTKSADIAKMARMEPAFNNLSAEAQLKVLDGAFGFVDSTGLFEYVPNDTLKKFIKNESTRVISDTKNQFAASKQAVFETSYQEMVREYKAVGATPPTREVAMKIFDPQSPAKEAVDTVAKVAKKTPEVDPAKAKAAQAKQQVARIARIKADEAVTKARALNTKLAQERKEKAAEVAKVKAKDNAKKQEEARVIAAKQAKQKALASAQVKPASMTKAMEAYGKTHTNLSQKEINELFKKLPKS